MSSFYEVGRVYMNPDTGWKFRVDCITEHPEDGERTALGWRFWAGSWGEYSYGQADWDLFGHLKVTEDDDDPCADDAGVWYPRHDYGELDCLRCGAEPEDGR